MNGHFLFIFLRVQFSCSFLLKIKDPTENLKTVSCSSRFFALSSQTTVLDLVSQVLDVVLINVYLDLGNPRGSGFWNEEYMGKGREMERSVYEQPENEVDRILSQQGGFQVS
jgi:hypothetical protein